MAEGRKPPTYPGPTRATFSRRCARWTQISRSVTGNGRGSDGGHGCRAGGTRMGRSRCIGRGWRFWRIAEKAGALPGGGSNGGGGGWSGSLPKRVMRKRGSWRRYARRLMRGRWLSLARTGHRADAGGHTGRKKEQLGAAVLEATVLDRSTRQGAAYRALRHEEIEKAIADC